MGGAAAAVGRFGHRTCDEAIPVSYNSAYVPRLPRLNISIPLALVLAVGLGCQQYSEPGGEPTGAADATATNPPGLWSPSISDDSGFSNAQRREIERLRSIGYVRGVATGPAGDGVVTNEPDLAQPGLNLYHAGHAPEAFLLDMEGRVLHRWHLPYEEAFKGVARPEGRLVASGVAMNVFWRRVHLYPNGDLLAIFEGLGLVKLDRHSGVLWAVHNSAHHELAIADSGDIYVLTRRAHIVPAVNATEPILEDFITVLSSDGKELRSVSVLEAILNSEFSDLLDGSPLRGDIMHTNTLKLLEGIDSPRVFRGGTVLTSFRKQDALAVIDMRRGQVVWALQGITRGQHDPTLLDDGNLLVFDNRGRAEGASRVIEVEPDTGHIVWRYPADGGGLFTECCGASQRLPNGNTLITYSEPGQAVEVTRDGTIVWEFHSPHRAGVDDTLIAQLMEVRRLPEDFADDWLR